MDDLTTLTDNDLDQLRIDVTNELERRQRLASAPAQVADIARRYTDDGGDPTDLATALEGIITPAP
ncbi:hypothetical protein [Nocardioides soli]|uniref:Uncharacterized protein n=1 Tax=Nocardioides soli TaxID=1036020 RepID=A0A7W4YZX8_9ACTN|nr:hypothetical protein [Nocardioides soli]MBB3041238.1 hypothetical protein [Nocardioides soli]